MKRIYEHYQKRKINEELIFKQTTKIIFKPRKRIKMENNEIIPRNLKSWTPIKKGEWLEEETKKQLDKLGFSTTITKSHTWIEDEDTYNKRIKIIGDNGIDGYARKKIGLIEYKCIIQCKCYGRKSQISTDVIAQLENNVIHMNSKNAIGLLVVLNLETINERVWNAAKNAKCPIIIIEITNVEEIVQQLKDINWMDYPENSVKRKRIEVQLKEAQEISTKGNIPVKGKGIKKLRYYEESIEQ